MINTVVEKREKEEGGRVVAVSSLVARTRMADGYFHGGHFTRRMVRLSEFSDFHAFVREVRSTQ